MIRFSPQVVADAGLYREWFAQEFGAYATFGASHTTAARGNRHARRLAALVGISMDEVFETARADYAAAEAA